MIYSKIFGHILLFYIHFGFHLQNLMQNKINKKPIEIVNKLKKKWKLNKKGNH